jgi:outer membrane protein assembly factor BamB
MAPLLSSRPIGILAALAASALIAIGPAGSASGAKRSPAPAGDEWPTSLHDVLRSGSSTDAHVSPRTASKLRLLWKVRTGGPIATTPTVAGGIAYFGSWDGNEYAVNATTGALVWKTYLGVLVADPLCIPPRIGPSSPATVIGSTVYVGGADGYWYALDAHTGAVQWRVWTSGSGTPNVYDGHFNWSGPLIVGNDAYVGVASLGDCPLVQGQLLKINLATHAIEGVLNTVPNGEVGGGIWTSPAYDQANGLIYTVTGTRNQPSQQFADAFLAVDPATMQIVHSWPLSAAEEIPDSDFSTSTMLLSAANGLNLVVAQDKNGFTYALNRSDLAAGPVWRQQVAVGGECPTCGDGTVSSGAYGGGHLYVGGNRGIIGDTEYPGTVRALDPTSGAYVWQHGAPGNVVGALAYDNGMVLAGGGSVFEVLDAKTGRRLYSFDTGAQIYAGPSVARGVMFTGNIAGELLAFGLPRQSQRTPLDRNCPRGFTCQDVGHPEPRGGETRRLRANGSWTFTAGGPGLRGTRDGFRMLGRPTRGDAQVVARIAAPPTAGGSQMGVVLRQSAEPDSPYYGLLEESNHTLVVQYRRAFGEATSQLFLHPPGGARYLMIQRHGDLFEAAVAMARGPFHLLPGTNATIPMPYSLLGGVAAAAGRPRARITARVSGVRVGAPGASPEAAPSPHPCPASWSCQDVGNPALVGDQTLTGEAWTVEGAGGDIWSTSDEFHFVWRSLAGDGAVSAGVTAQANTDPNAKAGVMLRAGTGPSAPYYAVYTTPGHGVQVHFRSVAGGPAEQLAEPGGTVPVYLRAVRSGVNFLAQTSPDGVRWTQVAGSTITLPHLSGPLLAGLALTSHNTGVEGSADFTSVTVGP